MITIDIDIAPIATQHRRGLITNREFAIEVWRQALTAHPFLKALDPHDILAAVVGFPAALIAALDVPEPLELADQLLTHPELAAVAGERIFPIATDLALLVEPATPADAAEGWHFTGRLIGVAGSPAPAGMRYTQWQATTLATLLMLALDANRRRRLCHDVADAPHRRAA